MNAMQKQTLGHLKSKLSEFYQDRLESLYLFGSQARETAEAESDIDVIVVLKWQDDCKV